MDKPNTTSTAGCPSRCARCGIGDAPQAGDLRGWRLSVGAVAVFVLPLLTAIAGASLGGDGKVGQFVGAAVGLFTGLATVVTIAAMRRRSKAMRKES